MISPRDAFGAHSTPEGGRGLWVTGYGGWGMGDGERGEIKREENMKTKPNTMQKKGKMEIYDDILEKSA